MTNKRHFLSVLLFFLFFLSHMSFAQRQQEKNQDQRVIMKFGLSAEYFNLTIGWDEDVYSSKLKSYIFSSNTEIDIFDGFSIHFILGYSLSNFDDLVFRQLPFSVELGVKEIKGLLVGTEINKRLFYLSEYEISLQGQFVYYNGFNNEWDMQDLNVDGTITGSPSWSRAQIGPKIRYEGLNTIYPFISATFNELWGTFTLDQDIQDLFGTEEKKLTGKSNFTFSAGSEFIVTSNFLVNGVLSIMPYNGGMDIGAMISIQYVFQSQNRRTP